MIAWELTMWTRRFLICLLLAACSLSALASPRSFPPNAKIGTMSAGADYTQIVLDAQVQRLSPGAQIKNKQNTIIMPTSLMNKTYIVNYTFDRQGMVDKVWILTDEEIALITSQ
jgi:hypothetical protein